MPHFAGGLIAPLQKNFSLALGIIGSGHYGGNQTNINTRISHHIRTIFFVLSYSHLSQKKYMSYNTHIYLFLKMNEMQQLFTP